MADLLASALVLDCDGTLADTEPISDHSWRIVLGRRGHDVTAEDIGAVKGHPWPVVWDHYVRRVPALASEDRQAFRDELSSVFAERFDAVARLFDDALALVEHAVAAGLPVAVCSSSGRRHLRRVRELHPSLEQVRAWVGREDTDEHKPRPAPYLEAARRLAVDPRRCVAVEDTPVGATAALAAGMHTVGIDRGHGALVGAWPEGVEVVSRLRTSVLPGRPRRG